MRNELQPACYPTRQLSLLPLLLLGLLHGAAGKAVELDNTLAEVHYALAVIKTGLEWDWEAAEIAYRKAIELNPNFPDVRAYYSHLLFVMNRPDEALAQMAFR